MANVRVRVSPTLTLHRHGMDRSERAALHTWVRVRVRVRVS